MANSFYDWTGIGITEINNLYLYGLLERPENIDMNRTSGVTIEMNAVTFMSGDPSRTSDNKSK